MVLSRHLHQKIKNPREKLLNDPLSFHYFSLLIQILLNKISVSSQSLSHFSATPSSHAAKNKHSISIYAYAHRFARSSRHDLLIFQGGFAFQLKMAASCCSTAVFSIFRPQTRYGAISASQLPQSNRLGLSFRAHRRLEARKSVRVSSLRDSRSKFFEYWRFCS